MSIIMPVRAMHGCLLTGLLAFQDAGVVADGGCAVTFRPVVERVLCGFQVLLLATPGFYRGILKCPSIRETNYPRFRHIELVDRIQMRRRKDFALTARQK